MELSNARSRRAFTWFACALLAYNLAVILWGAYVRVSYSGDGCGAHWPTCEGQFIPAQMARPMAVEFTHRMMTVVDSLGTIALCSWAFFAFPKRHQARRYASLALLFLFIEALLGAGLVLFRLVAKDASAGRAWYLSAHLTNTMLLLGAYTLTAWLASRNLDKLPFASLPRRLLVAVLTTITVSITGAIAALGDTLFPAASIAEGVRQDFSSGSSMLLRLRLVHPIVAVLGAVYLIWVAIHAIRAQGEESPANYGGRRLVAVVVLQVLAGFINIYLLAPVWMQLVHLLIADVVWIALVLLVCETLQMASAESQKMSAENSGRAASMSQR